MIALTYTLELLQPLLATGLGAGDPNSKRSLAYVAGSMVRGALIGAYLRGMDKPRLDIENGDEVRLFLSDTTCYLNAYPQTKIGNVPQRLLPTPRSWQQIKPVAGLTLPTINTTTIYDSVIPGWQRGMDDDLAWTRAGGDDSFCWHDGQSAYLHRPARAVIDHTSRDRRKGRASREEGNLFRYDALATGQTFAGLILTEAKEDAEFLQGVLTSARLAVGGAQRVGYGAVRVSATEIMPFWEGETEAVFEDMEAGSLLLLTALSPWLLVDEEGNPSAELSVEALGRGLAVEASQLQALPATTRRSLTTVGGFNRTAGLPLSQQQAIVAGSVFAFRTLTPLAAASLQTLQEEGIGLQRLDGYGRLAVNWQQAARYQLHPAEEEDRHGDTPPVLPLEYHSFAQQIGQRILRQEMEQDLADAIHNQLALSSRAAVSNSQLARLRAVVRAALLRLPPSNALAAAAGNLAQLGTSAVEPISEFLKDLKPPAQEQLQRTKLRVGRQEVRLLTWLQEEIAAIRQGAPRNYPAAEPMSIGSYAVVEPPAWQVEYALRRIDGILARAAKQAQRRDEEREL